jgi:hypothetical protein
VIQKDDFITKYNNKIYKIFIDKYKRLNNLNIINLVI